jgi:hypothetical protein
MFQEIGKKGGFFPCTGKGSPTLLEFVISVIFKLDFVWFLV